MKVFGGRKGGIGMLVGLLQNKYSLGGSQAMPRKGCQALSTLLFTQGTGRQSLRILRSERRLLRYNCLEYIKISELSVANAVS